MNTKIMGVALAAFVGVSALSAQDKVPAHKTVFAKDKASAHWFLELGNAAMVSYGGSNSDKAEYLERVSLVNPTLGVGKWHSPYFATRLQLQGGELKHFPRAYTAGKLGQTEWRHKYVQAHYDFMFDLVNYFSPYKENRFFHVVPFVGVGAGYIFDLTTEGQNYRNTEFQRLSPSAHAGLQLKLRLAKRVDLNIEGQVSANNYMLTSLANTKRGSIRGGVLGSLGASLGIHLGKKEFTPIARMDEGLLRGLNDELNALRAENAELRKRPEGCPEPITFTPQAGVAVGNVVYFRLNSDKVDANQMINIRNIAEYAKNNTETITLVGYADRETGKPDYNYNLSERRAKAVAKILVEQFGISADRIKTSWEGDRHQPYAENVWNRVVIMNAEK